MYRALAAALVSLALPASAAAAEHTVSVGDDFFSPKSLQVAVGDTVNWVFASDSRGNHSVTTKSNQPESFDSDPGTPEALIGHPPGYKFSYTFTKDGVEVDYFCKVHPVTMTGTVVVGAPPADTTAPVLSALRAKLGEKVVKISFKLDEAARVVLKLASAKKPNRTLRTVRRSLGAGSHSIKLRRRGLAPGRYRARLTAEDEAGNSSPVSRAFFKLAG